MSATTFMTGREPAVPPPPPLAASPRLSLADGLRLLRTPSSEAGVLAYHRALEGAAPSPQAVLDELSALQDGRATRFEILTHIALSPKARARGVAGPGLLLIRLVRKAFVASGAAARVRGRRAAAAQQMAAHETVSAMRADAPAALESAAPPDLARRLVLLEGALIRLENRIFADARAPDPDVTALEARVAALEAELAARLDAESDA